MTLAMVDSSSGAASASAMNDGDDVGRRRQDQHAAHDRVDLVQPELEAGRDAEVAAAAADRPEEVRVRLGVDAQELAVGGHDVGGQQVVDREAVLADQVPDAAAQRDPPDPDRAGVAEPGRQAVRSCRGRVLARGQTLSRPTRCAVRRRSPAPACPPGRARSRRRETLWPATLWPPLRTASSSPVSRASETTRETSLASAGRTMTAGRRSNPP